MAELKHGQKCNMMSIPLSTTTAAEYGDLSSLRLRLNKKNTAAIVSSTTSCSITNGGHTPLHLAAQHDQVAVTSFLLQNSYRADTGQVPSSTISGHEEEPIAQMTPLHRAAHSGALGCIQILLDYGADVHSRDHSMGDAMTPLHKAVKGGRYLAVALILKNCLDGNENGEILKRMLRDVDSKNRTPLKLARELRAGGQDEVDSVRRWDSVAGGCANWSLCVKLLEDAEADLLKHHTRKRGNEGSQTIRRSHEYRDQYLTIPDCNCTDGGPSKECKIATWESVFRSALFQSTTNFVSVVSVSTEVDKDENKLNSNSWLPLETDKGSTSISNRDDSIEKSNDHTCEERQSLKSERFLGQPCTNCGRASLVLFRSKSGSLVCRSCQRSRQRS